MNRAERRAAKRRGVVDLAVTLSIDPVTGRRVVTTEAVAAGEDPRAAFERNMARADAHLAEWGET